MDRILAFGVHPDDVEYAAGGTLALLRDKGFEIHVASLAGGEVGHPTLPAQQIRERRLAENQRAAALVGGTFHFGGCHDLEVQYDCEHRRRAVRIMREVDPLIVLTLPPMDYLLDHEEGSKLVRNAAYIASVPNYDCGVPTKPTGRFPYLYYWNASRCRDIFGRPLPLHMAVNVTSVIELKRKMIECHESQFEWLKHHNKWEDFGAVTLQDSREQGKLIGADYAEGFIQHLGNGHPTDNILKTLLGDLCVEFPDRPVIPENRRKFV
ncbi:MAG: N-acetyl-alpha-D-glucosaminyl L-malate deacetylase 1 [Verrucomicrobiae bacterium]|nr:N-acetyl-alpha-D-glucosaminyl L-malate deacetylase 1 [Verrucomicrobiae bacterium]